MGCPLSADGLHRPEGAACRLCEAPVRFTRKGVLVATRCRACRRIVGTNADGRVQVHVRRRAGVPPVRCEGSRQEPLNLGVDAPDDSCGPCMRPGCPRCRGWLIRNSKESADRTVP